MKRVLLLLCKGFETYEFASFYDVLGWSGSEGLEAVEVTTVGLQNEVRGTFGIRVIVDKLLSEVKVEDFDALAVPGGFETYGYYEEAYSKQVCDFISRFNELNKPIASICVGALPLGKSGILKGRRATTYHLREGKRRKQLADFGVEVVDEPLVIAQNVITSTSPATAMRVAFELLSRITSEENSDQVRKMMGFEARKRA
jgi:4-methyl-5(b-hydroxyethyl)-thiazole monophosphate biosynthesis